MEPSKCFQMTLIRHGETEENRLGIIQGQADTLLNDLGREQAALASEKLSTEKFTSVYSSDLVRAKETADIILSRLEEKPDIVVDVRLREKCFGTMEGTSYSELIAEAKRTGVKSIMKFCPPGAETVEQLLGRTKDFFCDICNLPDSGPSLPVPDKSILSHHLQPKSQEDGMAASVWSAGAMPSRHVLVATHGGIIVSMLKFLQPCCEAGSPPFHVHGVPNCSITSLIVKLKTNKLPVSADSLSPRVCTVVPLCVHDTSHLDRVQSTL